MNSLGPVLSKNIALRLKHGVKNDSLAPSAKMPKFSGFIFSITALTRSSGALSQWHVSSRLLSSLSVTFCPGVETRFPHVVSDSFGLQLFSTMYIKKTKSEKFTWLVFLHIRPKIDSLTKKPCKQSCFDLLKDGINSKNFSPNFKKCFISPGADTALKSCINWYHCNKTFFL